MIPKESQSTGSWSVLGNCWQPLFVQDNQKPGREDDEGAGWEARDSYRAVVFAIDGAASWNWANSGDLRPAQTAARPHHVWQAMRGRSERPSQ